MKVTYRQYMLGVMVFVWAFNAVDVNALGLAMQNIKIDLHLSDTQLGVLTGIATALLYSIMGVPLARWADRGNRVTILSLTAAVWSVLVCLCGTATSFIQLLLLRMGVGIGEAGCMPTSQSLLADYYTRAERPRAMALFLLGDVICMFFGLFVAGWLNQLYGWRVMFGVLGLPGLLLAALVRLTFKEPRLQKKLPEESPAATPGIAPPATIAPAPTPSLKDVYVTLWTTPTFRHLLLYWSIGAFFASGIVQWQPSFLIRSYSMSTGELGTWMGFLYGSSILVGRLSGGELASRLAANNERLQLKVMALTYCLAGVCSTFIYLSPHRYVVFAFMWLSLTLTNLAFPPSLALLQTLVPERMRAVAVATVYFCAALLGNGFGPLAAGALSDLLRPHFGEESLRYALMALSPGYVWAAWYLWRGSHTVTGDLQRVVPESQEGADRNPDVSGKVTGVLT